MWSESPECRSVVTLPPAGCWQGFKAQLLGFDEASLSVSAIDTKVTNYLAQGDEGARGESDLQQAN